MKVRSAVIKIFMIILLVTLNLLVLNPSEVRAQVGVVTVKSEGAGSSKSEAIYDALQMAIGQINGVEIASEMRSAIQEISVETDKGSAYLSSENFQKKIAARTKGIVRSWRFIDEERSSSAKGEWTVVLEVSIAKFRTSKQVKRLRLAIVQFRINPEIKNVRLANKFRIKFEQTLENTLTQSRRFAILDRKFLGEQTSELNFIKAVGIKTEELARIGNRVGTDLIVLGSVESVSVRNRSRRMKSTGQLIDRWRSEGRVSLRIIDVATTQIKYADSIGRQANSQSIDLVAKRISDLFGEKILNAIFPISVVSVDSDSITLGQGGSTVQEGQILKLIELGAMLRDPYTKEVLGRKESEIGLIEISNVQSKFSTARIIRSRNNLANNFQPGRYIVRPVNRKQGQPTKNKDRDRGQIDSNDDIEKIEKKSKDDW
jgi:hypothetical protein